MNRLVSFVFAIAALLAAAPAFAQYGALAYDPETRAWGQSHDHYSPREAEQVALSYCRSGGCRIIVRTGPEQCGAIAAARYGSRYHWSTRNSRGDAEYAAIAGCQQESGDYCRIIVWQCNR